MIRHRSTVHVRLYKEPDCPKCETLWMDLVSFASQWGITLEVIDVTSHPVLFRRFGGQTPVVDVAGVYEFRAPVQLKDVRQAILTIRRGWIRQRRIYERNWRHLSRLEERWNRHQGRDWRRLWFERIRHHHPPEHPLRVLEMAVGPGLNAEFYPPAWQPVWIDWTSGWVSQWRARIPRAMFVIADIHSLPFSDETFDLVLSSFTLCAAWHLPRIRDEVYRVLRPNGAWWWMDHGRGRGVIGGLQRLLRPLWFSIAGCFPDRPVADWLREDDRFTWRVWSVWGSVVQMGVGVKRVLQDVHSLHRQRR